jgi:hypothetical protein
MTISARGADKPTASEHVKVTFKAKEATLRQGAKGTILVTLTPAKGIHINLEPAIAASIEKTPGILGIADSLAPPKNRKTGYLNTAKPIHLTYNIAPDAKPGRTFVAGTIVYTLCSEADGWCSKARQTFKVPVVIQK